MERSLDVLARAYGVAGQIIPWTFSILIAAWKLALAAGIRIA